MKKSTSKKLRVAAGVGAGLAAAATALGVYYFSKPKNRKKVRNWVNGAKLEVIRRLKSVNKINQAGYNKIIDEVAKKYGQLKNIESSEILQMVKELKGHWNNFSKHLRPKAKVHARRAVKRRGRR